MIFSYEKQTGDHNNPSFLFLFQKGGWDDPQRRFVKAMEVGA